MRSPKLVKKSDFHKILFCPFWALKRPPGPRDPKNRNPHVFLYKWEFFRNFSTAKNRFPSQFWAIVCRRSKPKNGLATCFLRSNNSEKIPTCRERHGDSDFWGPGARGAVLRPKKGQKGIHENPDFSLFFVATIFSSCGIPGSVSHQPLKISLHGAGPGTRGDKRISRPSVTRGRGPVAT